MAEPISAVSIATLAFLTQLAQTELGKKFIESAVGKLGEKTLEGGLGLIHKLKGLIIGKMSGNAEAEDAIVVANAGEPEGIDDLAYYLKRVMKQDPAFANELQQIAQQIINIEKVEGRNVMNVFGGQGLQVNDPQAPTIQAGENANFTFNYGKD
ncbi:MAG: hypothetical protein KME18_25610 [Phormidium tanganyikae FI6-MK23]|jgi:hypothetical protein|nr:hypothetical protein [Phormidium tanganyikae FI6-MK23]